jgi:geranylgeranyl reductase family protein
MYDCLIVGAGPAGATAAYHLAKRGYSALILEKESLPRYKPCGGGVSPAIAQWFDFDFSPAISLKINTIRYTWKMEDPVEASLQTSEPVWMVRRDIFDHFLVQQAQKLGAELKDSTEVTGVEFKGDRWQVNTAQGQIEGRYLIAASGARGLMPKWLGFKERKPRTGVILEAPASSNAQGNSKANFEFGLVKNGYIWNFPKADGYSISGGTFRGGEPSDLEKVVTNYAAQFGIDTKGVQIHHHPLCLWDGEQKLHTQNALLAGEAACLADPMTAEGIRPSIFSGVKAAEAIAQSLAGDSNALAKYSEIINEEWGSDMVWAQRLAGVFYRVPGVGYRLGVKRPAATSRMGQVLCGELRYSDIASTAIKRLSSGLIPGMGG